MKKLVSIFVLLCGFGHLAKAEITGVYGLHLFFNEKEFVDVLKIYKSPTGQLAGEMIVPNDFNGKLSNVKVGDRQLSFDLFVPKNSARPQNMVFSYRLIFFDNFHNQFVGFANLQGKPTFIGSFVGFKRPNAR